MHACTHMHAYAYTQVYNLTCFFVAIDCEGCRLLTISFNWPGCCMKPKLPVSPLWPRHDVMP